MADQPLEELFATGGPLAANLDNYELRIEQLEVARRVEATVQSGGKLVAEAGTGVGKTLAYLLPAITSGLKVVVSTGTKNLQDQIVSKDLPLIERALGIQLDVRVMKGRTNYLCHLRADRFMAQMLLPAFNDSERQEVARWRQETATGDRAELLQMADDSPMWRELSATSEQCTGRDCADFERCWVTVMRRRAQVAQIVVVNHHLYFADLALRQRLGDVSASLVPAHDLVIFDEAHDLDEVAAQHFGFQVSDRRIHDLIYDVQHAAGGDPGLVAQLTPPCEALHRRTDRLFGALTLDGGRSGIAGIARDPVMADRHLELDQAFERLEAALDAAGLEEGKVLARRASHIAAELTFILEIQARRSVVAEVELRTSGAYVRYAERLGRARNVVARPLVVSDLVRSSLDDLPAVFVSATLAVGGDFSHFRQRLGLLRAKEIAVGSPFDYESNACLYLPDDLPVPDDPEYATFAAERAAALVAASGGGAFVLCTSRRVLPLMRAAIERDADVDVLMQGDAPRSRIIEQFRSDGHAVLVATMSFWQGVDVPGTALRLVVIDRLPFASPGDPLVAARLEAMREAGDDPFMGYQVPQAALLLRQGFGRLIRRQSDRGLVAILDRRIMTRRYGRVLLASLPSCPRVSSLEDAATFLAGVRAS